ncbi:transmembrane protein 42 isoform X2 [Oryzias latipes]|uniref:transmembrane protein 42 isoform X2 n=1 Tax=Oryzias latipes TaxID=8090 RepID=UPI0009DA6A69|nr:transmembrane protein 42 isoform X2 [Oryzias latipes]
MLLFLFLVAILDFDGVEMKEICFAKDLHALIYDGLMQHLHIPLRLLCGGLLFTCNAVMWTFLAKALRYSSSSTRTTVTTTASNFISSAFLGQLIFGEAQIKLWWVGISLTFSGLLVLQRVSPQDGRQSAVHTKDE